ncbi:hypothetical protein [Kitasatospora sp. McL0602]|uniref:hypothetical protein n=1 Tax=Kitasatospora sp. McL0602 TaxID=3439530 RepID=UPI003F88B11D
MKRSTLIIPAALGAALVLTGCKAAPDGTPMPNLAGLTVSKANDVLEDKKHSGGAYIADGNDDKLTDLLPGAAGPRGVYVWDYDSWKVCTQEPAAGVPVNPGKGVKAVLGVVKTGQGCPAPVLPGQPTPTPSTALQTGRRDLGTESKDVPGLYAKITTCVDQGPDRNVTDMFEVWSVHVVYTNLSGKTVLAPSAYPNLVNAKGGKFRARDASAYVGYDFKLAPGAKAEADAHDSAHTGGPASLTGLPTQLGMEAYISDHTTGCVLAPEDLSGQVLAY